MILPVENVLDRLAAFAQGLLDRGPAIVRCNLAERPFLNAGAATVVVVTGAAGSIVSAITADLAAASGGTFHLLDLTPTPDAADPDLEAFRDDRDGLKTTIAERMKGVSTLAEDTRTDLATVSSCSNGVASTSEELQVLLQRFTF